MLKIGIYTNKDKDPGLEATGRVIGALETAGCSICYDSETAGLMGLSEYTDAGEADALFILGGDGTILRAARKYVSFGLPMIGINIGHLGFMSEINLPDVERMIDHIKRKDYVIDERMLLEAKINGKGRPFIALNDFIITKINRTRMVQLDLYVNGTLAELYNGDGLIVATPTGSTAYSLSAGGPIIAPNVSCILVTPMCPHSLYARSIVTKYSDTITVRPHEGEKNVTFSADGQELQYLSDEDEVIIRRSQMKAKFLRFTNDMFFPQLKDKLAQWSGPKK
ncbi:NAD(+)/NADH kinase [Christensenella intestinihominis]|uniref:NAD(+)/NADH kinase n=1 Tax=Christensenella intestinihominis TaxID=1851429 RepID=UPI00082D0727|nr:NAD(+)/NADH kinase [Christensenella intestinihominis]